MKKKDGRPPRSLSAWRALQARGELEARFPDVAMLIDTLVENVDPDHVETALADAIGSLKTARGRSRESLPVPASVDERRLHAAADVERLAQDRHALERLAVAVKAELDGVTADLADAEARFRHAMLERDPVDRHELAIARKLRAAGLTDRVAREFNADQVTRMKTALEGGPVVDTCAPRPARRKAEVALAWTADNAWASMSTTIEHYRLDRRPMTTGAVDIAALRRCGLPPDTDLAAFGAPHLVGRFEAAPDARAKARTCWDICEKWIADNIVDDVGFGGVAIMRERAWTFLFGVRYGFAHEIRKLDRVMFPSPWGSNEYVVAQLRD